MNKIIYRSVDYNDEKELLFIADTDTHIPAKFDREFPTDEKMILDRLIMAKNFPIVFSDIKTKTSF